MIIEIILYTLLVIFGLGLAMVVCAGAWALGIKLIELILG
jgi:hypothetical protein